MSQLVSEWLETNPAALNAIVSKALMAARAADAAKKARELVSVFECVFVSVGQLALPPLFSHSSTLINNNYLYLII